MGKKAIRATVLGLSALVLGTVSYKYASKQTPAPYTTIAHFRDPEITSNRKGMSEVMMQYDPLYEREIEGLLHTLPAPHGTVAAVLLSRYLPKLYNNVIDNPDSPYDIAMITNPLWGLESEEIEERLRTGEIAIKETYVRESFYKDIGKSEKKLKKMVPFPIESFRIMTSKQEKAFDSLEPALDMETFAKYFVPIEDPEDNPLKKFKEYKQKFNTENKDKP